MRVHFKWSKTFGIPWGSYKFLILLSWKPDSHSFLQQSLLLLYHSARMESLNIHEWCKGTLCFVHIGAHCYGAEKWGFKSNDPHSEIRLEAGSTCHLHHFIFNWICFWSDTFPAGHSLSKYLGGFKPFTRSVATLQGDFLFSHPLTFQGTYRLWLNIWVPFNDGSFWSHLLFGSSILGVEDWRSHSRSHMGNFPTRTLVYWKLSCLYSFTEKEQLPRYIVTHGCFQK